MNKSQKINDVKVQRIGRDVMAEINSEEYDDCDWIEKAKIAGREMADRVLDETEVLYFPTIHASDAFAKIAKEAFDMRQRERYEQECNA